MLHRKNLVVVALGVGLAIAAGPARAQHRDDQGWNRRDSDQYGRGGHERWERDRWEHRHGYGRPYLRPGYYAPPPVYYAPAPRPYYAPPPVFTPPGFGLFVPFR